MLASPMLLIFIVPFALLMGVGDLLGIDIGGLTESFDFESFRDALFSFEVIIEMFYKMFG
ncbi:MAG: hypothetical protein IJZ57_04765 [Clostridia bacterium]|nr:hypothetical protein [Clostridia bacterium]